MIHSPVIRKATKKKSARSLPSSSRSHRSNFDIRTRCPKSYEEEISAIPSELLKEPSEQLRHSNEMSDENGFVPIPSLVILKREASRKDGELGRFTEQAVGNEAMVI